jgi:uncharacterized protein (DUF58 family)
MAGRITADDGRVRVREALDWGSLGPLRLRSRAAAEGTYAGAHRSARKGAGIEFGGHREYVPGDDLRWLDRHSLLRHDRLLVRQFETETDRAVRLVVDATKSMGYRGKRAPGSKLAWSAVVAAALARVAISSGDPVGLTFFGGRHDARGAPVAGGRESLERILAELEGQRAEGDAFADARVLEQSLAHVARTSRRGSMIILFSDLLDLPEHSVDTVAALGARGRVLCVVQVLDRDEVEFPFEESVRLKSLEGDVVVETDGEARAQYLARLAELEHAWRSALVARGARFVSLDTSSDPGRGVRRIVEAMR